MSEGVFWGSRNKYIHSVGPVGKVKFIAASSNPFDGVFTGADYGLLRFSSASAPWLAGLGPGFGLKFLKDGVDSSNLVAARGFYGGSSDNWNYFSNDFSNWIKVGEDFGT
jgi:hypothetical protein